MTSFLDAPLSFPAAVQSYDEKCYAFVQKKYITFLANRLDYNICAILNKYVVDTK